MTRKGEMRKRFETDFLDFILEREKREQEKL
jgi:hypothetical protein